MSNTDEKIQVSGPRISDLPRTIFVDILLKLSTKSIIFCKCVCKTWHIIISDPQFAKLHLAQAKAFPLIRDWHSRRISRALYLLEPEDGHGLEDGYCWCGFVDNECNRCRFNIKVKTKLKIPVRNAQVMFSHAADDARVIFNTTNRGKREHLFELKSAMDHTYSIVNSCNGLLCLTEPAGRGSVVVCNPVTGEFIYLPESCNFGTDTINIRVGLGFSPKNNQYKVIRMFNRLIKDRMTGSFDWSKFEMVEIHTLGTDSWRSLDISELKIDLLKSITYLNGAMHWLYSERNGVKDSRRIVSFDLDKEQFDFHDVASPACAHRKSCYWDMTVVGRYLCLCTIASDHCCTWVMKDYGVWESWTKLFDIDIAIDQLGRHFSLYRPLIQLNNGALLIFGDFYSKLIYFDQLGGLRFKRLKFRGIASRFEAIAHIPSFISLKDIVKRGNVEVLNVNSRCGELILVEESYPLLLGRSKN